MHHRLPLSVLICTPFILVSSAGPPGSVTPREIVANLMAARGGPRLQPSPSAASSGRSGTTPGRPVSPNLNPSPSPSGGPGQEPFGCASPAAASPATGTGYSTPKGVGSAVGTPKSGVAGGNSGRLGRTAPRQVPSLWRRGSSPPTSARSAAQSAAVGGGAAVSPGRSDRSTSPGRCSTDFIPAVFVCF